MAKAHSILELQRTDARILVRMERVESICLAAAAVMAAANLMDRALQATGGGAGHWAGLWTGMSTVIAVTVLVCGAGLGLSTIEGSHRIRMARVVLGLLTVAIGLAGAVRPMMPANWLPEGLLAAQDVAPGRAATWLVAVASVCLGTVVLFAQEGRGRKGWIPDGAIFGAVWVVVTLMAGVTFGALHVFGQAAVHQVTPATTIAFLLLTVAAVGRRIEYGRWSIFIGRGVGSGIARGLLPVVLLLPLARELMRARMMRTHVFPDHYAAAILAATGTMIALLVLLVISWQLRRLEWEVQGLSLRDELTGLYNLRGFHLLAQQALRMSRRSCMPFSVLFVDVDGLKLINDQLGHAAGSRLLVEAAEFLQAHFRETDVLGRLGGDEFAVAGQFSADAIEEAEQRLEAEAEAGENADTPRLSLSMGHVTVDPQRIESLEELLKRADAAMYERKRMKKMHLV
jgi:diguanylate cyclase (GGDEF)-like protein